MTDMIDAASPALVLSSASFLYAYICLFARFVRQQWRSCGDPGRSTYLLGITRVNQLLIKGA